MTPSPRQVSLRPIRPADAEVLANLRIAVLRECPIALTADLDETLSRPAEWWQEWATRSTGEGRELIMVADAGDVLAGMAGVRSQKNPKLAHGGDVWGVYVRPDFRRQGLGEALLRGCIDWARAKGLLILRLGVAEGNDTASRCYERCGFQVYGVDPQVIRWQGRLYDEFLMFLRL